MALSLLQSTKHDIYPFIDPRQDLKNAANGKTILVTGGGSGIGRAIAEHFALAGASEIFLASRRRSALEETKAIISKAAPECKVLVFGGIDIANHDSITRLFDALPTCPDVLVSNAGVSPLTANLANSDPDSWLTGIDVNIKGSYFISRAYAKAVAASGKEGCLINVSSCAAWRYVPGRSSYARSKVAMNSMTEYINRECEAEGHGLRAVAMHPGGVMTDLITDDVPDDIRQYLIDQPALPGGVAVYLSTDRARFLGGRCVDANWDLEELEKHKERVVKENLCRMSLLGAA